MNLRRWLTPILVMGLIMALTPINALAWRGLPFSRQNHQGFMHHQPQGHAYGWHGQRPPMFQHNRPFLARGHHPYQQSGYGQYQGYRGYQQPWLGQGYQGYQQPWIGQGYQGFQQPWIGQAWNYGAPYAPNGCQGYPYQGYSQAYQGCRPYGAF